MNTDRPSRAERYGIFEGFSERTGEGASAVEATLEKALKDLWERSGEGEKTLRVIEIEIYGSNPIDMFHVTASGNPGS